MQPFVTQRVSRSRFLHCCHKTTFFLYTDVQILSYLSLQLVFSSFEHRTKRLSFSARGFSDSLSHLFSRIFAILHSRQASTRRSLRLMTQIPSEFPSEQHSLANLTGPERWTNSQTERVAASILRWRMEHLRSNTTLHRQQHSQVLMLPGQGQFWLSLARFWPRSEHRFQRKIRDICSLL